MAKKRDSQYPGNMETDTMTINPKTQVVVSCKYRDGRTGFISGFDSMGEALSLFGTLFITASMLDTENPLEVLTVAYADLKVGCLYPAITIDWHDGPLFPDLSGIQRVKTGSTRLWDALWETADRLMKEAQKVQEASDEGH